MRKKPSPMKMTPRTLPPIAAALIAACLLGLGLTVHAAGYKKADKTGASIAEFRDEILNVKKEVDTSMMALDRVVAAADTDPRKPYAMFAKTVPQVDAAASKARSRAEDMKARGQAYFKQWEKDLAAVNDPEIRKLAEERKAKLQSVFGNIRTFMEPARDQFKAWLAYLKDLQKYLDNDLTIAGIEAAKDQILKAQAEGRAVQESLGKVIAELNTIVATITPATAKK